MGRSIICLVSGVIQARYKHLGISGKRLDRRDGTPG